MAGVVRPNLLLVTYAGKIRSRFLVRDMCIQISCCQRRDPCAVAPVAAAAHPVSAPLREVEARVEPEATPDQICETFAITLFGRYLPRQLLKAQKMLLVSLSALGGAWLLCFAEANYSGQAFVSKSFRAKPLRLITCSPSVPSLRTPSRCRYSLWTEFVARTMAET